MGPVSVTSPNVCSGRHCSVSARTDADANASTSRRVAKCEGQGVRQEHVRFACETHRDSTRQAKPIRVEGTAE